MALEMKIAVMLWGSESPSLYRESLRELCRTVKSSCLFSDKPLHENELHYLRFSEIDKEEPFHIVLHNVDDGSEFAASFPYISRRPGVLFLGDIFLHQYARAVSHSADDGWGYRWIVNVAYPEGAETLARLAEDAIRLGAMARYVALAPAMAVRSAAVVVPDYQCWQRLAGIKDMPPIEIIPPPSAADADHLQKPSGSFHSRVSEMLPRWAGRSKQAEVDIAPLDHPNKNLFEMEKKRMLERFDKQHEKLGEVAVEALSEFFST